MEKSKGRVKKVLVVDDELGMVGALEALIKADGYDVSSAIDGIEGLKKAREEKPDLIILDINMPGLDGYQVCRMLKHDNKLSGIAVLMLTQRKDFEDREWGERVKADEYMTKPFDEQELLAKIRSMLNRKRDN